VNSPGNYAIEYDPTALKELATLDKPIARRVITAIEELGRDPRPGGTRRLVGYPHLWRLRVGDYRVIYMIRDADLVVLALRVAHRSSVYRRL
jgi:mRNA interferase RelE/StbE